MNGTVTEFVKHHYRHFNAAALIDAAEGYKKHLEGELANFFERRVSAYQVAVAGEVCFSEAF